MREWNNGVHTEVSGKRENKEAYSGEDRYPLRFAHATRK